MVRRFVIPMMQWMALLALSMAPLSSAAFDPGTVYWAPGWCSSSCGFFEVTAGDQTGANPMAAIERSPGQITWSDDVAYVTQFDFDSIVAITSAGAKTTFASNVAQPTGLLFTSGGTLLVVSWSDAAVYYATAGGDLSAASAFADGFSGARNLLQLATGQILLADQTRRVVYDISAGGDFSAATPWASGLPAGPYDLVQDAGGRVFGSTDGGVFEITGGGDFSAATAHATGQDFAGLAVDAAGRLLASDFSSGDVYDITTPGNYSAATPLATNFLELGDTALDSAPGASVSLPPSVPAMGAAGRWLLAGLFVLAAATTRRR